jgi:hypothetical protein
VQLSADSPFLARLYYDESGNLIFASAVHYRAPWYIIYFHNDTVIRLIPGERGNEPANVLDEHMTDTVNAILDVAYL